MYDDLPLMWSHLAKDWGDLRPGGWVDAHAAVAERVQGALGGGCGWPPPAADGDALRADAAVSAGRGPARLIVPGCGAGRLAYDLAVEFGGVGGCGGGLGWPAAPDSAAG